MRPTTSCRGPEANFAGHGSRHRSQFADRLAFAVIGAGAAALDSLAYVLRQGSGPTPSAVGLTIVAAALMLGTWAVGIVQGRHRWRVAMGALTAFTAHVPYVLATMETSAYTYTLTSVLFVVVAPTIQCSIAVLNIWTAPIRAFVTATLAVPVWLYVGVVVSAYVSPGGLNLVVDSPIATFVTTMGLTLLATTPVLPTERRLSPRSLGLRWRPGPRRWEIV